MSGGARPDTARRRAEQASACLRARDEQGEVFVTERRGHAKDLATAAVARGARLIVAWGGDGTVNEVGCALAFCDTPLAVVPSGSGNGLARALGVSPQPERALADAFGATPRAIDAGEMGGRLFFCVAGAGFDAHVAACFDRDRARRRGLASYARLAARELLTYRSGTYRIDDGNRTAWRRAFLVTLANASEFGNGARIAPAARVDDGRLDLVVVEEVSRVAIVMGIPRLFTGGIARVRGVTIQQVERASIGSDRPLGFHVDGEPVEGGTCLDARVHPGALRVCVR